jgi:hypothetical protein
MRAGIPSGFDFGFWTAVRPLGWQEIGEWILVCRMGIFTPFLFHFPAVHAQVVFLDPTDWA